MPFDQYGGGIASYGFAGLRIFPYQVHVVLLIQMPWKTAR